VFNQVFGLHGENDFDLAQALIKYFSSWQQASQTKNFLPSFFINLNFGYNSITASCI
jgi:hypothetical protein